MAVPLTESIRTLIDGRNFAVISTLNPDGAPQSSTMWVGRDGDAVVFTAASTRRKVRNVRRDPRVSVAIFDQHDPYHSVEIRGRAEVVPDEARTLPMRLSHKYVGEDPPPEPGVRRVIVRVVPEKVTEFRP